VHAQSLPPRYGGPKFVVSSAFLLPSRFGCSTIPFFVSPPFFDHSSCLFKNFPGRDFFSPRTLACDSISSCHSHLENSPFLGSPRAETIPFPPFQSLPILPLKLIFKDQLEVQLPSPAGCFPFFFMPLSLTLKVTAGCLAFLITVEFLRNWSYSPGPPFPFFPSG